MNFKNPWDFDGDYSKKVLESDVLGGDKSKQNAVNNTKAIEDNGLFKNDNIVLGSNEVLYQKFRENLYKNHIKFTEPTFGSISNFIKRIQIRDNQYKQQLYSIFGEKLLYDRDEYDFFGNSIDSKNIELPVNTRVFIVGTSINNVVNDEKATYIYCFHNGKYREGFIASACLSRMSKQPMISDLENNKELCLHSFLDDSSQIIDYAKQILVYNNQEDDVSKKIHPKFLKILSKIGDKFNLLKSQIKYDRQVVIDKIFELSFDNSLKLIPDDKPESLERWLNFSGMKEVFGDSNNWLSTTPVPISKSWIEFANSFEHFNSFRNDTTVLNNEPNVPQEWKPYSTASPHFEANIMGVCASNTPRGDINNMSSDFLSSRYSLLALHLYFKNTTINDELTKSPEAIWLKSLNKDVDILSKSNFILFGWHNWQLDDNYHFSSLISIDHSIGYVNSVCGLSSLIHEINTFLDKRLRWDTHFKKDEFEISYKKVKEGSYEENKIIELITPKFKNYGSFYEMIPLSLNTGILYLDYYLNQILQQ